VAWVSRVLRNAVSQCFPSAKLLSLGRLAKARRTSDPGPFNPFGWVKRQHFILEFAEYNNASLLATSAAIIAALEPLAGTPGVRPSE
jgi:hypothetical protein